MDTLFRLVSLQPSSEDQKHQQYFEEAEQECSFIINYNQQQQQQFHQVLPYYFTMDNPDEHFSTASASSSSSSKAHYLPPHSELQLPNTSSIINNPTTHQYHTLDHEDSSLLFFSDPTRRWASDLLLDCARAVAFRDSPRVQHLMWILNELASPYGDLVDHKLASYFLQALFARLTSSGPRTLRTLSNASDRSSSFDSTRRTALRFQELSPWSSFGHVAANAAILESFFLLPRSTTSSSSSHDRPTRLHILDLSTTFCTQWPTLLEALATRSSADETPHVSITAVVPSASPAARRVMREIAARMEKFGRLMAVPFRFSVVHHPNSDLSSLDLDSIITALDSSSSSSSTSTLLAVNCVNSLHGVPPSDLRRETLLAKIRRLRPGIITVVEEEADLDFATDSGDEEEGFLKVFREGLRFFSAYFDSLEECFPKTSNERLALERAAGRAMVDLVACPAGESSERRDTAAGWSRRMRNAGFLNLGFSEDVNDDMRALLKRYKEGWGMRAAAPAPEVVAEEEFAGAGAGIFLTWKEEAVVWASVWKLA